jgi:sortase A
MRTRALGGGLLVLLGMAMIAAGIGAVAGAEDGAAPATPVEALPPEDGAVPRPARPLGRSAAPGTSAAPSTTTTAPQRTTTTPSSAPTTTTTVAAPLPTPEPPPADPYADVPVVGIGRIKIPAIGLDHEVYEGVWLTVIDVGPGHWPGTAAPGAEGNAVFGGHRVTHSHPFLDIVLLRPGDEIVFEMYDGSRHVYAMTEQFVVYPDALWVVDQAPGRTLTLFACHPKGSARQRIVVRGVLVGSASPGA